MTPLFAQGSWLPAESQFLAVALDWALKATILLGLAGGLVALLHRASAAVRHYVSLLSLGSLLVLPLLTCVLPGWRVPVLPASVESSIPSARPSPAAAGMHRMPSSALAADESIEPPAPFTLSHRLRPGSRAATTPALAESPTGAANAIPAQSATGAAQTPVDFVLLAWLFGAIVTLAPLAIGAVCTRRLRRRSRRLNGPFWSGMLESLKARLALRRGVALLETHPRLMPMTWGVFRPVIALPADADQWPADRQRTVLLHELAHVKRWDVALQFIARLACALYWFHPLVWQLARRMRLERERACDDCVLAAGEKASTYAADLLSMARTHRMLPLAAAITMARPTQLEGRLLAVLDPARRRSPVSRRLGRLLLVAMLLLAAAVAIVRPHTQARGEGVPGEASARGQRSQPVAESEATATPKETAAHPTKEPADEIRLNGQAQTGTLAGRVLDAKGRPVAGADVRLKQYEVAGDRARGTTDESGSYRFEGVPEGHYVLVASAPGMARSFRLTPVEGGELPVDVVLRKPVVPVIELRDEDGRSVAGARVRELRQRGDNGEFFLRRVDCETFGVTMSPSDTEGRLRLPPLPAGTIFTATIDHHQQAPVRVPDVTASEGTVTRATMARGVPLALHIQPAEDGSMVTDLSLMLFHEPFDHPSTTRLDRVAVDRDGTATLAVEAGNYGMLWLQHEDFFVTPQVAPRGREFLQIANGRNDQLSFRLHRKVQVRGRVTDASTRRPLAGMEVRGEIANAPSEAAIDGSEWSHAGWSETDENGEYTLSLAAGRVRVEFESEEYIAARDKLELDVAADGSTVAPDFEVRPLPAITGRVLDTAGNPVAGAIVRFRGRWLRVIQPVVTDERGRFELQPPRIPVDPETETRLPEQPIVAFHPYEPLSAVMRVRLDDADAVSNVTLMLEKSDYESVLSDFVGELSAWERGDTSAVPNADELLAKSLRGKPAPELDGAAWINTERPQMSLADFRGRYVLLDFWFIGCGPCHYEFPSVKLVHELYKDHGVTVIGVHRNSAPPEAVRAHAEEEGLPFPIVVDHPDGRIEAAYRAHYALMGFPSYVLIGPDGNVIHADHTVPAPTLRINKLEIIRLHAMGHERTGADFEKSPSN